jgi:NAD(P)-dependent dehydrogenase (short-subunit alcohol dehydrogenase family)
MAYFDLKDKVCIITGSSRGIGRAAAEAMAEGGAKVVISSRKLDACQVVVDAINQKYGEERAIAIAANISDKAALQHLADATLEKFGKIDALVCNAASNPYYGPMQGISDEQFNKILHNNILSNHWLIQYCAPLMSENGGGAIVIVSSVGGFLGSGVIGAYNISKAADMQLARNLAVDWGRKNIRVNCVCPGVVKTDFAKALWENPEQAKAIARATPLNRVGEVDDIGGVIAFLCSPASKFMSGQSLIVDGGMTITGGNI